MHYYSESEGHLQLITQFCAIVGGVFYCLKMVDACFTNSVSDINDEKEEYDYEVEAEQIQTTEMGGI
jgi:hypothetical protein